MYPSITRRLALDHALSTGKFPAFDKVGYYHRGRFYSTSNACISNTKKIEVVVTKKIEVVNSELPDRDDLGKLHPWFVTGFADGEACFTVSIRKYPKLKIGWSIEPSFAIGLHIRNTHLLEKIHAFFGVGQIKISKVRRTVVYSVHSVKDLTNVIIPHFCKYPLLTQKGADFELFKMIIDLINSKEHSTIEGIHKIVSIRGSLNWGLTPTLAEAFPDIIPVVRPLIKCTEIPHPYWLIGFVEGEGCFEVCITKSRTHKTGYCVQLRLSITQDSRDIALMSSLIEYLKCGSIFSNSY